MNITPLSDRPAFNEVEEAHVRRITQAPLQMVGSWDFDVTASVLFPHVSDPSLMARWFPFMKGGDINHAAVKNADWGEGSKRLCYTSTMSTLDETIHYWDAPNAYTYNVKNSLMPVRNHLGLLMITPNDTGGATLA